MDSGNSGSLQSSSGAEEEYDSGQITTHQSNNLNPLFFSPSPQHQLLDLDSVVTLPSLTTTTTTSTNPIPPVRKPKKRSRASRRAPTTVLTTDTNNFRAMVQEFTGIPSPPFTSPVPAKNLDLFCRSNTNYFDNNLTALPSYLLPQKLRPFPYYSSPLISSFIDSCNLLNTMQNPSNFPYNNPNQSPLFNPKSTQNLNSLNGFGANGQTHILEHHTTLPDLLSTAATTSSRNEDNNGKESSGMKGFIEPWDY